VAINGANIANIMTTAAIAIPMYESLFTNSI
jgi:hypothetical protein